MNKKFWSFALKYCFRNLWRNKRRTMLTIATVTVSVMVAIISDRYSSAALKLWVTSTVDSGAGHAQIVKIGFDNNEEGLSSKILLKEKNKIENILSSDLNIKAFTRRLELEGIISAHNKTIYFLGHGISPKKENIISPKLFHNKGDQGKFISDDDINGIVIGKGLADSMNIKLGEDVTLIAHASDGSINAEDAIVRGIINIPFKDYSKRAIYMHIKKAQSLVLTPKLYSHIAIRTQAHTNLKHWYDINKNIIFSQNGVLKPWWMLFPVIPQFQKLSESVTAIISILLFISAAVSVLNIIFMLVSERTTEIGTLMAIGSKRRQIRRLFMLESALIGFIGAAIGAAAGNIIVLIMGTLGVPFDNPFTSGYIFIYPKAEVTVTIWVGVLAVIICIIAAVIPANFASRLEPVKAFRGQVT